METLRASLEAIESITTRAGGGERQAVAAAGVALVLAVAMYVLSGNKRQAAHREEHWDAVCQQALQRRDGMQHKVLQGSGGNIDEKERDAEDSRIARLRGSELVSAMRNGALSCERVVAAFCRRAHAIGNLKTKGVTEEFYDEAVEAAKVVDADKGSDAVGSGLLLRGMPMSIKDAMHMKGALTTCGMACKVVKGRSEDDGLLVKVLRAHGAIPYVRGNVPQCMMLPESDNAIFGRSENPWDPSRTPGGSSGGDASLVASRCAPLALGSDIGGSIRIPCHFTGTCGLKPTPQRISLKGMEALSQDGKSGQRIIHPTSGPIANYVGDLELAMTALCSPEMWDGDKSIPRLPWDRKMAADGPGRPLKVGFFKTDHWFQPCAAIVRAVEEAAEGLRAAGHEVVPFEPPVSGWEIAKLYYGQMGAEGNMQRFVDSLQGEKMLPAYASLRQMAGLPNFLRPVLGWVLRNVLGDERRASILAITRNKGLSVRQYYEFVGGTFELRSKWEKAVTDAGLDAVMFPPVALPALPHGTSKDLTPAFTYAMLANLLHWPAGIVPVTLIRPEEEAYPIEDLPVNQRDVTARLARETLKGSAGLPVGVQVMTTPFTDELALHVMREVERAVKFDAVPDAAEL
ncbi:unnamed protein product [Pylaiella littoralis]